MHTAVTRAAFAHVVLTRLEVARDDCRRWIPWYEQRRDTLVGEARDYDHASEIRRWYDDEIERTRQRLAFIERILDDGWQVTSDEYPDLAAGDHFVGVGQ